MTELDKAISAGRNATTAEQELRYALEISDLIRWGETPRFSHVSGSVWKTHEATGVVIRALPLRGPDGECLITEILQLHTVMLYWYLADECRPNREKDFYRRLWEMQVQGPTPLEIYTASHPVVDPIVASGIKRLIDWARPLPDGTFLQKQRFYENIPECPRIRVSATGFDMDHHMIRAIRGSPDVAEIEELFVRCKAETPDSNMCGEDGFERLENKAWCNIMGPDGERWTRFLELLIPLGLLDGPGAGERRGLFLLRRMWEDTIRIQRIARVVLNLPGNQDMHVLAKIQEAYPDSGLVKFHWMSNIKVPRNMVENEFNKRYLVMCRVVALYHSLRGSGSPLRTFLNGDGDNALGTRIMWMLL